MSSSPRHYYGEHCIQKLSLTITSSLERFFYFWGFNIGKRPWIFISGCILFTLVCSIGLQRFTRENRPDKLWIPSNSDFLRNSEWLRSKFPAPIRFHNAIIMADDVLTPSFLELLAKVHHTVRQAAAANNRSYEDLCFRLPVTKLADSNTRGRRRKKWIEDDDAFADDFFDDTKVQKNTSFDFDPSIDLPQSIYCDIINSLEDTCWEINMAELWNFDNSRISSLTKEDILHVINGKTISPVFGRAVNYTTELSGIVKNETGHIIKATAVLLGWFGEINYTDVTEGKLANDMGTGEIVNVNALMWESVLIKTLLEFPLPEGVKLYINVARSFGDISNETIWNDASMFAIGFSIVFVYVFFMLGKCNAVEQRPLLSLAGLSCVALAIVVSYGICSTFGLFFSPVHNSLPFLLLGIGIDDMFVIMESWNNLSNSHKKRPLPERIGLSLRHAGVSITITSVTDFIAFVIGGTTVLPSLQSFCIYAAFGIIATYIFQATFFTAWLALDVRRVEAKRNAFFICYKHNDNYKPNNCSQINFAQKILGGIYSDILLTRTMKGFILLFTLITAGVGIWGNTLLRQEFNPVLFLPHSSYLFQYLETRDLYFPGRGFDSMLIMGNISLNSNLMQVEQLISSLESSDFVYDVDAWYSHFKEYGNKNFALDIPNNTLSQKQFDKYFSRFLFSPSGSRFRGRFRFTGNLSCGFPAPNVEASMFTFKFDTFGVENNVAVMNKVKNLVKSYYPNPTSQVFAFSFVMATWETDEIITVELYRNMGLAMLCVLLTTLLLIANVKTCLMVLLCVILTLVDVLGGMHFWNLTIDTVTCVHLVLAIGLCVDYAAHIGHTFMTLSGTRDERARNTLRNIGPAVLNGGISTFLSFILLASSKSHVFLSFFKIFFLVVVFGLFHGLVFFPVLLSLIGPDPYLSAAHDEIGEVGLSLNVKADDVD